MGKTGLLCRVSTLRSRNLRPPSSVQYTSQWTERTWPSPRSAASYGPPLGANCLVMNGSARVWCLRTTIR